MLLSDKYPFLTNYFRQMFNTTPLRVPQSIIFLGSDFESQFILSREIARILNCTGDKSDGCTCINCNWIRDNAHPAVQVISRVDNKPSDDESKTVISIKQANEIKSSLMTSSDFYRVFIFCDRDGDGNICGLNQQNFQEETANSLLKIIEEPSSKVMFIFLARYREDLLSTIVSRSQCFYVPSYERPAMEYSIIDGIFTGYYEFKRKDAFNAAEGLINLAGEHLPLEVLSAVQNYMADLLKSNPGNSRFIRDIEAVERAKRQIELNMNMQNVFENMCLDIIH